MTGGLRVALAGASGTGKTTLARFVSEVYGLPMNPVGSREVAKAMGFESPYDVDRAGKRAGFQARLLSEKFTWERAHEGFVTDRTVCDNLTYLALHDVYAVGSETLQTVRQGLARYTHVFFCPMASFFQPGDDPARVKSRAYHEVFESCLSGLINDLMGDGYVTRSYTLGKRCETVELRRDFVKSALGPPMKEENRP
jgi:predicted ATPase